MESSDQNPLLVAAELWQCRGQWKVGKFDSASLLQACSLPSGKLFCPEFSLQGSYVILEFSMPDFISSAKPALVCLGSINISRFSERPTLWPERWNGIPQLA